uniref:Transposase (Putative), gypsy type n=1 Tax=Tanacetum cinerariifolium TaxID=118510 RepID=A0A699GZF5_TANCI|nr:hypothetical protein [Tanacetum cinerariifolium]
MSDERGGPHTILLLYTVIIPCLIGIDATDSSGPEPSFDGPASADTILERHEKYTSRLKRSDSDELIDKYGIPLKLHPQLPPPDPLMSELPNDVIGIYHQMFHFSGVRILFPSFLLSVIKHFNVHFSQLGPLGLNKLVTFEVLCWSLEIQPTMTLLWVFQTICKQGNWFSFAKSRAPAKVCMDDNRSCMKEWKNGFFYIDRRSIPYSMPWRAFVVKLYVIPGGVLVLSGLSRVWRNPSCDPVLRDSNRTGIYDFMCLPQWEGSKIHEEPLSHEKPILKRLPFYFTPPTAIDVVIHDPTLDKLTGTEPNAKVLDKAEASTKTLLFPVPRVQTTKMFRRSLLTMIMMPIRMEYIAGDDIERDFFPCVSGLYHADYPKGGVVDIDRSYQVMHKEWELPHDPAFEILSKELFMDPQWLDSKECLRTNASGTALAKVKEKYKGRNKKVKSLTKTVDQLTAEAFCVVSDLHDAQRAMAHKKKDSDIIRLRDDIIENDQVASEFRSNLTSIFRDGFQGMVRRFLRSNKFNQVQGDLLSLAVNVGFEHGLHVNRNKGQLDEAMAKVSKFVLGAKARLDDVVPLVATFKYPFLEKVVDCCDRSLVDLAGLELDKLAHLTPILIAPPGSSLTSPPSPKELNVNPASHLKELASTDNPSASFVDKDEQPSKEQTKEWVEEMINKSDKEMAEEKVDKTVEVVVHGMILKVTKEAFATDGDAVLVQESQSVPSAASSDVTVALAATEEGKDAPIVDQDAPTPSRVLILVYVVCTLHFSTLFTSVFIFFFCNRPSYARRGARGVPEEFICCSKLVSI